MGVAIRLLRLKLFPLVSYFMKKHSLALLASERWEYPRTLISVWTLPLCHICKWSGHGRPFTNKVEKCTERMMGGARSIALYDTCTTSSAAWLSISWQVWKTLGSIGITGQLSLFTYTGTHAHKAYREDHATLRKPNWTELSTNKLRFTK